MRRSINALFAGSSASSGQNNPHLFVRFSLAKAALLCSFVYINDFYQPPSRDQTMATAAQPTVTLKHIAADLAEKHDLQKKQTNLVLEDLITHIVKNLKKGNRIRISGLGILQVKKRAARTGRNPATGETIQIPAKKKIAFRAAKELKEAVGK